MNIELLEQYIGKYKDAMIADREAYQNDVNERNERVSCFQS